MERILVTSWNDALKYKDHTDRYALAAQYIDANGLVLDLGCGVGYGSWYLAQNSHSGLVCGVDGSIECIMHARKYFSHAKTSFFCKNLDDPRRLFHLKFDLVVCFELLEHVRNDLELLNNIFYILKPAGKLILSVPNEASFPFASTMNPYHFRHYSYNEIVDLLHSTNFKVTEYFTQTFEPVTKIERLVGNTSNIFICVKA